MIVTTPLIGRFGNKLFQYAYARAYAEKFGHELRTSRWIGEKIFQIEPTAEPDGTEVVLGGYCQNQESLIYTRQQVKEWFRFRPEIQARLDSMPIFSVPQVVAHVRRGDYEALGYPVVSRQSYYNAFTKFGYSQAMFVSEEQAAYDPELPDFLPDFYRMMKAPVLFRANSTFSYWAGVLGDGIVYSPVVENCAGGKECDCEFIQGNWPRFCNLPNITDLHLQ